MASDMPGGYQWLQYEEDQREYDEADRLENEDTELTVEDLESIAADWAVDCELDREAKEA